MDSKEFEAATLDERLKQIRSLRDDMASALLEKISRMRDERDEMIEQYNNDIASLENELDACGTKAPSNLPSEIAVRAFNFLRESAGVKFSSQELMSSIRCSGAVASIVLRPFLDDGRIKKEGEYRAIRYFFPG